jgi:excisionase family DNA binding protein
MPRLKTRKPVSATTRAELRRVSGVLSRIYGDAAPQDGKPATLKIDVPTETAPFTVIELSAEAVARIVALIEKADTEIITPSHRRDELTTQQAADRLGVSRPYLIKLLDAGKIPCRRIGKHRRVRAEDVARFERAEQERRAAVMRELVAETEALGMYP